MKRRNTASFIFKFAALCLMAGIGAAGPNISHAFFELPPEALPVVMAENDPINTGEAESGPVEALPWENDEAFLMQKETANTPILMGAYRAVLHDPLPGEEYNVHLAASMLAGIVIKPGEVFSQNSFIGPYTAERGFQKGPTYIGTHLTTTIGGGVCKIASTLYNVTVLCDLQIVERSCHSMPVPYVPYGQDATVAYGAKDFKFRNDTPFPVMIWAQGIDNILYIAFYGRREPPVVEWHHDVMGIIKAQTIFRRNPALPSGTEKVVLEGMDGATVKSRVTVRYADGTVVERNMGVSYYQCMPYVVERGD